MKKLKVHITILILMISAGLAFSQSDELPSCFMIGEHEKEYEMIVANCNTMLLSVSDNSMESAYASWTSMLKDMETYADTIAYDLKGIKVWINVFWEKDGSIANIVYYPKPNSRNTDFSELTNFFSLFIDQYDFEVSSKKCFSHYGSASWPTFAQRYVPQEK